MKNESMKHVSIYLAMSLILVSFILGIAGGYYLTPEYNNNMVSATESMGLGNADRYVDLRYIDKMISHHRGAVLLAQAAEENTTRREIHILTKDILETEPKLIEELYSWKKKWYGDTRKVSDPVQVNLGAKDDKSDLRFLNALIAHHKSGIEMTTEIRTKSVRSEILDNADTVENFLSTSMHTLQSWREAWYGVK